MFGVNHCEKDENLLMVELCKLAQCFVQIYDVFKVHYAQQHIPYIK